jgi:D-glycero-alpha-D-manno-heptose-7-phosphate kinase
VYTHFQKVIHPKELAELACHIEIERLNEPIGKQDQYISAFGGISEFVFEKTGEVKANALTLSMDTIHDLEDHLLLFFTGQSRSASMILQNQVRKSLEGDLKMRTNLDEIKQIGFKTRELLTNGKTREFGSLLNDHWALKKSRGDELSNSVIDNIYEKAMKSGALGGKLIGAGGGGFLMFYASDTEKLKSAMKKIGAQEVRFRFDFEGTKIIMT